MPLDGYIESALKHHWNATGRVYSKCTETPLRCHWKSILKVHRNTTEMPLEEFTQSAQKHHWDATGKVYSKCTETPLKCHWKSLLKVHRNTPNCHWKSILKVHRNTNEMPLDEYTQSAQKHHWNAIGRVYSRAQKHHWNATGWAYSKCTETPLKCHWLSIYKVHSTLKEDRKTIGWVHWIYIKCHWINYTESTLAEELFQWQFSGNLVLICMIGTHWLSIESVGESTLAFLGAADATFPEAFHCTLGMGLWGQCQTVLKHHWIDTDLG